LGIQNELEELRTNGVIDDETAARIRDFYLSKSVASATSRGTVIISVLGALFVGLGIILVLAHNWDQFSRAVKTAFAFMPLVTGQVLAAFAFFKKQESTAWRESTAVFLFTATGACIALIAQIFNLPGAFGQFMFTWTLLTLPLVFLLRSDAVLLLNLGTLTLFALSSGDHFSGTGVSGHWFWPVFAVLLIPHSNAIHALSTSRMTRVFHFAFPASLFLAVLSLQPGSYPLVNLVLMSLFALFYLFGTSLPFQQAGLGSNGYVLIGKIGTAGTMLVLSPGSFWETYRNITAAVATEFIGIFALPLVFFLLASALFWIAIRQGDAGKVLFDPFAVLFLLFGVFFLAGVHVNYMYLIVNIVVLATGVVVLLNGLKKQSLSTSNFGLLLLTALITLRFFDTDLSFFIRGLVFIAIGAGFFVMNGYLLRIRKNHA
jgi:uncharacterized membrane protein